MTDKEAYLAQRIPFLSTNRLYNKYNVTYYIKYGWFKSTPLLAKLINADGGDVVKAKKPLNIEIGQRIKQAREAAGLTQEVFAERIGLGVKHVSAIECGAVGVSLPTLRKACKVLLVSADSLLFDEMESAEQSNPDAQILLSRLLRLPPDKFRVVKDILDKLLEVLAV